MVKSKGKTLEMKRKKKDLEYAARMFLAEVNKFSSFKLYVQHLSKRFDTFGTYIFR